MAERCKASYFLADPKAVPADILALGPYDLVIVDAILTRQTQPLDLLAALSQYVRPGGVAVIASTNDWDPRVTPRNCWLGGFKMNGEDLPTLAMLKHALKRGWTFVDAVDVSRLTREHERKFVLEVLETSVWRRRAVGAGATGGDVSPVATAGGAVAEVAGGVAESKSGCGCGGSGGAAAPGGGGESKA